MALRLGITNVVTRGHYPITSVICGLPKVTLWTAANQLRSLSSQCQRHTSAMHRFIRPLDSVKFTGMLAKSQGTQSMGCTRCTCTRHMTDLQPQRVLSGMNYSDPQCARTVESSRFRDRMSLPSSTQCTLLNWRWKVSQDFMSGNVPPLSSTLATRGFQQSARYQTVHYYSLLGQCRLYSQDSADKGDNSQQPPSSKERVKLKETVKEQLKKDPVLTIPNVLTTMRMGLAPVIGYLVLHEVYSTAFALFVLAGISDVLDGWIARNFENQTSAIGSFIDPLADKLLVSILCVTLTMMSLIPVPLTALIITRDLCLIVAAFYVRYISLPPPKTLARYFEITMITAKLQPTFISKLNTAVQLSLVAASLAAPIFSFVDHQALHVLWYLTAGTTVASGLTYVFAKDTFKIIKQAQQKQKS